MNIALPSAQQALHFTDGSRQWVVTAYGLAFGGLLLVGGRIGDMVGRKRTFLIGWPASRSPRRSAAGRQRCDAAARAGTQGVFAALLAPAALVVALPVLHHSRRNARRRSACSARSRSPAAPSA